jgi:hypothetical protein
LYVVVSVKTWLKLNGGWWGLFIAPPTKLAVWWG